MSDLGDMLLAKLPDRLREYIRVKQLSVGMTADLQAAAEILRNVMREEQSADPRGCNEWMHHGGDCPPYENLAATIVEHARDWLHYKSGGMDVLASSEVDNAIELLTAMRDVV